jgi:hypothetical protein
MVIFFLFFLHYAVAFGVEKCIVNLHLVHLQSCEDHYKKAQNIWINVQLLTCIQCLTYMQKKKGQCNVESKLKDIESSLIQRTFQPWHHELL